MKSSFTGMFGDRETMLPEDPGWLRSKHIAQHEALKRMSKSAKRMEAAKRAAPPERGRTAIIPFQGSSFEGMFGGVSHDELRRIKSKVDEAQRALDIAIRRGR